MKREILSVLLLFVCLTGFAQSKSNTVCRLGFTYDISRSNNWGKGKPVITGIIPYTPAEQSGIKQNDIIETIDGVPLTSLSENDISQLLNPANKNSVVLTISNLSTPSHQIIVKKECKKSNAITEDQLAIAFAMYSLETSSDRQFTCPFKTITTPDSVNFAGFKTFAFATIEDSNRRLETVINECIAKELIKKGMKPSAKKPDMLIQTFYFFDKNHNYKGANKVMVDKAPTYRYNFTQTKMEKLPFLNYVAAEAEAQYLLQLGFRMIDQRYIPGRVLWECEANELLEDSYRLEDYARVHIPLMSMQYPYVKYTRNVPFKVSQRSYNYTGISYDIDRLELVVDVDRNSPAYSAGLRPRDVIEKISNHRMDHSAEEFSAAYKQFITSTMSCRDPKTLFTDANGFKRCMYWNTFKYPQVVDAIQNPNNMAAFSYLYYFAPYINPSGNNACTFQIKRGKTKLEMTIRPTIRSEVTVEIK